MVGHFAGYLHNVFHPSTDEKTLEVAADTMGHLVRVGGPLTADVVEFEVRASTLPTRVNAVSGWPQHVGTLSCLASQTYFSHDMVLSNTRRLYLILHGCCQWQLRYPQVQCSTPSGLFWLWPQRTSPKTRQQISRAAVCLKQRGSDHTEAGERGSHQLWQLALETAAALRLSPKPSAGQELPEATLQEAPLVQS